MTIRCNQCGFYNPPGMRFCGNCGSQLSVTSPKSHSQPDATFAEKRSPVEPENLGVMVGTDLLERMHKAGLEASGQRRNVTILFTDLSGYTGLSEQLDSEDVYDIIQEYVRLLANDVYKYEGIVDKLTGDGLMALFGAPIAHENNAERAVLAALDMQADIKKLSSRIRPKLGINLQMRVGLHSGIVVVGGLGSNLMMDYTAIGDTVNLAHRIEEVAEPETILVSESVYGQTRALFDYHKTPDQRLKGVSKPISSYKVIGPKSNPGTVRGIDGLRAPMIGRDTEFSLLESVVRALAEEKQGQFVLIIGDAGIGKSRLTAELKASVAPLPVRILDGQSLAYRRTVSYWTFHELFYNLLGVAPNDSDMKVQNRLRRQVNQALGNRAAEILPYLEYLLSLPFSNPNTAERIHYLDASQLRQQVFLAVRDFLIAESNRQPLLLVVDDLHWADEASLDLLLYLLDSVRQAPICILGISRPSQDGQLANIAKLANQALSDRFTTIRLQSLSPDEIDQLLSKLLAMVDFPPDLRAQIIQRSAGIPFYIEEILRMLIDHEAMQQTNGTWQFKSGIELQKLGVPDTLQGLILARFDRLPPFHRYVLGVASVIGNSFEFPLLTAVINEASDEQIENALLDLVERDFLRRKSGGNQDEYAFRHMLMSEAIYGTLLKKERSRLHGQVGQAIERLFANRLEEQVELLARHYSWSPNLERALHYLILAGQKAARGFLNLQSQQHFQQALELLPYCSPSLQQILQIHMGLGDILVLIGEYQQARMHYQKGLEYLIPAENPGVKQDFIILQRKIGTTYERQGEYDQSLLHLSEAQNALKEINDPHPVVRAQILSDIGWIDFRRGDLEEAEQHLTSALNLALDTNHYDVIASIFNRLGGIFFQKDQLDQASSYVRKSLVLREEIGDTVGVARSFNNLGLLGWRKGDWDSALDDFQRSLELTATLGDVEGLVHLHSNIGLLQTDKGNLTQAHIHLDESLQVAKQIGHSFLVGLAYMHLSRYWLAAREWHKSLQFSQQSLAIFAEIGSKENLVDLYTSIGEAWLGLADLDQAQKNGEIALQALRENTSSVTTLQPEKGRTLRLLGNISRLRGDLDEAASLLKESVSNVTAPGNQLELGRSLVAMALLAQARHNHREYRLHMGEARLIFRQLGAGLDLQSMEKSEG